MQAERGRRAPQSRCGRLRVCLAAQGKELRRLLSLASSTSSLSAHPRRRCSQVPRPWPRQRRARRQHPRAMTAVQERPRIPVLPRDPPQEPPPRPVPSPLEGPACPQVRPLRWRPVRPATPVRALPPRTVRFRKFLQQFQPVRSLGPQKGGEVPLGSMTTRVNCSRSMPRSSVISAPASSFRPDFSTHAPATRSRRRIFACSR